MSNIGLDLDNVLIKRNIQDIPGVIYTNEDIEDWEFSTLPEATRNLIFDSFKNPNIMCNGSKPIKGAQEKVSELWKAGHFIVVITARHKSIWEQSIRMINSLFICDAVECVDFFKTKSDIWKDYNIDYWVDDAPHGVVESCKMGINTYLVSNNETKYNWHTRKLKGINVIESIRDFNPS